MTRSYPRPKSATTLPSFNTITGTCVAAGAGDGSPAMRPPCAPAGAAAASITPEINRAYFIIAGIQ